MSNTQYCANQTCRRREVLYGSVQYRITVRVLCCRTARLYFNAMRRLAFSMRALRRHGPEQTNLRPKDRKAGTVQLHCAVHRNSQPLSWREAVVYCKAACFRQSRFHCHRLGAKPLNCRPTTDCTGATASGAGPFHCAAPGRTPGHPCLCPCPSACRSSWSGHAPCPSPCP